MVRTVILAASVATIISNAQPDHRIAVLVGVILLALCVRAATIEEG